MILWKTLGKQTLFNLKNISIETRDRATPSILGFSVPRAKQKDSKRLRNTRANAKNAQLYS